MKFKEYMKRLEKIVGEHPKSIEYEVVYSIDEQSRKFGVVS